MNNVYVQRADYSLISLYGFSCMLASRPTAGRFDRRVCEQRAQISESWGRIPTATRPLPPTLCNPASQGLTSSSLPSSVRTKRRPVSVSLLWTLHLRSHLLGFFLLPHNWSWWTVGQLEIRLWVFDGCGNLTVQNYFCLLVCLSFYHDFDYFVFFEQTQ